LLTISYNYWLRNIYANWILRKPVSRNFSGIGEVIQGHPEDRDYGEAI